MRDKWVILDKSARWWKNSKEVKKWVIREGDDFWIINGSEFPEKKITKKDMKVSSKRTGQRSVPFTIKFGFLIILSSLLGISLAMNIILYLINRV